MVIKTSEVAAAATACDSKPTSLIIIQDTKIDTATQAPLLLSPVAFGAYDKCPQCEGGSKTVWRNNIPCECPSCEGRKTVYRDTGTATPLFDRPYNPKASWIDCVPKRRIERAMRRILFPIQDALAMGLYDDRLGPFGIGDSVQLIHSGSGLKSGEVGEVVDVEACRHEPLLTVKFPQKKVHTYPEFVIMAVAS